MSESKSVLVAGAGGFIEGRLATTLAERELDVSFSWCMYHADKRVDADDTALTEADAYPAMPTGSRHTVSSRRRLRRRHAGDSADPVDVGSSELVSINQMVDIIERIAAVKVRRKYKLDAPLGGRGRNSDYTMTNDVYGWGPSIRLADGLDLTHRWIYDELSERGRPSARLG